jgi:hypothetical protein
MKYTQSVFLRKQDFMKVLVVKVKFTLQQVTKEQRGSTGIALLFL